MIAALVLACLAGVLALSVPRLLRRSHGHRPPRPAALEHSPMEPSPVPSAGPGAYPESLTAELDPWDEEYLAFLADVLWPEDEYLDMEHTIDHDGEGDTGPGKCH